MVYFFEVLIIINELIITKKNYIPHIVENDNSGKSSTFPKLVSGHTLDKMNI